MHNNNNERERKYLPVDLEVLLEIEDRYTNKT